MKTGRKMTINKIIEHSDYIEILTQRENILVDKEDYHNILCKYHWGVSAKGYPITCINRKRIHLYWLLGFEKEHCDHINGNKLDNRRCNLRYFEFEYQNMGNQKPRKNNKTGYQGVRKQGNKYLARLGFKRKRYFLGYFDTPEEAARARDKKAKELLGNFAYLNFPDE